MLDSNGQQKYSISRFLFWFRSKRWLLGVVLFSAKIKRTTSSDQFYTFHRLQTAGCLCQGESSKNQDKVPDEYDHSYDGHWDHDDHDDDDGEDSVKERSRE